ncbi:hypothetical protein FRC11_011803, partial [Ceratobasidium sp. 423]
FGEFDYEIKYIPGEKNKLADALSRLYEGDAPGTVRAESEYVPTDEEDGGISAYNVEINKKAPLTIPLLVGDKALGAQISCMAPEAVAPEKVIGAEQLQLRRSAREHKPVQRLEISHAPTHQRKKHVPKWKLNKLQKRVKKPSNEMKEEEPKGEIANDDKQEPAGGKIEHEQKETVGAEEKTHTTNVKTTENKEKSEELTTLPKLHVFANPEGHITDVLQGRYVEDEFFKAIEANPSQFRNFIMEDNLIYIKSDLGRVLCIPNIKEGKELMREIESYRTVKHLDVLDEYLELQGVSNVLGLNWTAEYGDLEQAFGPEEEETGLGEEREEGQESTKARTPMEVNAIDIGSFILDSIKDIITRRDSSPSHYTPMPRHLLPRINTEALDELSLAYAFTGAELVKFSTYCRMNSLYRSGKTRSHPGPEPACYQEFCMMLSLLANAERKVQPTVSAENLSTLEDAIRDLREMVERAGLSNRSRSTTSAYTSKPPSQAPTAPRALRKPLADRIGNRPKPYEQPRTHTRGGEKHKRFWEGRNAEEKGSRGVQSTRSAEPVLTTTASEAERPTTDAETEGKADNNSMGNPEVAGTGIGGRNVEMDRGIADTVSGGTGTSDQRSIRQREDDWGLEEIIADEDRLPFDEYA